MSSSMHEEEKEGLLVPLPKLPIVPVNGNIVVEGGDVGDERGSGGPFTMPPFTYLPPSCTAYCSPSSIFPPLYLTCTPAAISLRWRGLPCLVI